MKSYSKYSEDDFIMDPAFQQWVKNPSQESDIFWQNFLQQYPSKQAQVSAAREILLSIDFNNNLLQSEKDALWNQIAGQTVRRQALAKVISLRTKNARPNRFLYVAAAIFFACALTITLVYFIRKEPQQLVATQPGQTSEILLPDNSTVTLNATSTIKYSRQWDSRAAREVWIDGEAFFSVKHTATHQPFIVHTGNVDIEVLGTEFNVMHREGRAKVSLNSGKIKLQVGSMTEAVFMSPGDILEIAASQIVKKPGNVEHLSVWKDKKLIFDDTPLSEILMKLKYIYGWEYAEVDPDLLIEKLSGEVETSDETKLIRTLEKALRIVIRKNGNTVSISRM